MSKATIGRKVHFVASAALVCSLAAGVIVGKLVQHDPTQPFDATITYVHSDNLVNLVVHDHNGHSHALTSITLLQPDQVAAAQPDSSYAYWPDYAATQGTSPTPPVAGDGGGSSSTANAVSTSGLIVSAGSTQTAGVSGETPASGSDAADASGGNDQGGDTGAQAAPAAEASA